MKWYFSVLQDTGLCGKYWSDIEALPSRRRRTTVAEAQKAAAEEAAKAAAAGLATNSILFCCQKSVCLKGKSITRGRKLFYRKERRKKIIFAGLKQPPMQNLDGL